MITFEEVKNNPDIRALIEGAEHNLRVLRYTEHGERHINFVSHTASKILEKLGYDEHTVELAKIAGYIHDVGNAISRYTHGIIGANLVYPILKDMGIPLPDVVTIVSAIGNHEEQYGTAVNSVSAALIIADKSDAHRTRVRANDYNKDDIHDRVNYSILKNVVTVSAEDKIIASRFYMDKSSSVMEFFQIYLSRIQLSEKAAAYLGCAFHLYINDVLINTPREIA